MTKLSSRTIAWTAVLASLQLVAIRPAVAEETLPPESKLVAIEAEPQAIELDNPHADVQLLLTGVLQSGDRVDVTRMVALEGSSDRVTVSDAGIISPVAPGEDELVFSLAGQSVAVPVRVAELEGTYDISFVRDVMPVLSKAGCNAGTCHGSKDGKNGFKLSLRGYDPLFDHRALTDDIAARRINRAAPDSSLMLLKSTSSVPHEGAMVIEPDSEAYALIRGWIAGGVKLDLEAPRVSAIEVFPKDPVVPLENLRQQMRIVATYADGSVRDVTADAFIESGNTDVATADPQGLVTALRRGEAPILARYEGAYTATTLTVMGDRTGFVWEQPPAFNDVDELVYEKLNRVKTAPGELCDDAEFLRRVHLDLTGLPPDAETVRAFLADERDTRVKRGEVIDRLVGSPEYVEYRTNKWADLLQVNGKFLGTEGASAFRNWIRQAIASNMPYDQFAFDVLTASGSNRSNPAASYYKVLRTPDEMMENTTHLFLGVRFNCNKCHDHPFERWTQDQYYNLAAYFARVDLKADPASGDRTIGGTAVEGAKPLYEVVYDKGSGEVTHDRTGRVTPPSFPYEHEYPADENFTRREELARWITSPDNRYFARSFVNRMWGYLTGVGLIEPLDDIRAGNPPSNPELLDRLTAQFIESGFDTQELVRTICKSRTYQLSIATNKWNEDDKINYSHAMARRLPAEVLYDAIHEVTGSTSNLPGVPAGMRAAQLPDVGIKLPSGFLDQLGRPPRESACECERSNDLMLGPVMALINGPTISEAIADPNNVINRLVAEIEDDDKLVRAIYLRIFNRPPTEREIEAGREALRGPVVEQEATAAALADYEAELDGRQAEWEQQVRAAVWQPLQPETAEATNGAKLVPQDDHSILAEVENGRGEYRVSADTDLKNIAGVRLELLSDERLPRGGPGRADANGNFVLSELKLTAAPAEDEAEPVEVALKNAQADFSQDGFDVGRAIDGDTNTGWANAPRMGENRTAVFELGEPLQIEGTTRLNFTLDQQYPDGKHSIGRFRLSVTDSPQPLNLDGPPANIAVILAVTPDQRSEQQREELAAHFRQSDEKYQQLKLAADMAADQGEHRRRTGVQDLAWALINSPAFLFNH
ncbi:MAG: DUF1549 domain-containing protein [Pirellulales bacterium]